MAQPQKSDREKVANNLIFNRDLFSFKGDDIVRHQNWAEHRFLTRGDHSLSQQIITKMAEKQFGYEQTLVRTFYYKQF